MHPLSSEHGPGTHSPTLMCEGDVNRGPLKNDVSISMLILGCAEKERVFLQGRMGQHSSKKHPQGGIRGPPGGVQGAGLGAVVGGIDTPPAWSAPRIPGRLICRFWKTVFASCLSPGKCHGGAFWLFSVVLSRSKPRNSLTKNCAKGTIPTEVQSVLPILSLKCFSM